MVVLIIFICCIEILILSFIKNRFVFIIVAISIFLYFVYQAYRQHLFLVLLTIELLVCFLLFTLTAVINFFLIYFYLIFIVLVVSEARIALAILVKISRKYEFKLGILG